MLVDRMDSHYPNMCKYISKLEQTRLSVCQVRDETGREPQRVTSLQTYLCAFHAQNYQYSHRSAEVEWC
jgi:hypothetical protein